MKIEFARVKVDPDHNLVKNLSLSTTNATMYASTVAIIFYSSQYLKHTLIFCGYVAEEK
jgi:hypothetical protein